MELVPSLSKGRVRPFSGNFTKDIDVNLEYENALNTLRHQSLTTNEIGRILENQFPYIERLLQLRDPFNFLPLRSNPNVWVSLSSLALTVYNPLSDQLVPISNFTAYPEDTFQEIRYNYLKGNSLNHDLQDGYRNTLAGKPMLIAAGKSRNFPTYSQLVTEHYTSRLPLTIIAITFYSLSCIFFLLNRLTISNICAIFGLFIQSITLALRCYILARPPVSNMYETMLYVPWIAMISAFILCWRLRSPLIIPAASAVAAIVLSIQFATGMDSGMENVQAVLDSQFWLIVHVLMVVGSYGLFLLCGLLGHVYLLMALWRQSPSAVAPKIGNLILQSMYAGTALLICGTVLGGVWAAQSWGRFWDWDPKESWAFISACIYLVWIHAYRFGKIGYTGLAIGSIVGLHAIVFTWYGVNYILGTGMHSYGFGAGGEAYYYVFVLAEVIFLVASILKIKFSTTTEH